MFPIIALLILSVAVIAIVSGAGGKAPLWVGVLLLAIIEALQVFPR